MKTKLTVLMLLLYSIAFGQSNLINAEYFIDHDPGYGNGTSISLNGDTAFIDELITNDIAIGLHNMYLRVQDDNGIWGMAEVVSFLVKAPVELSEVSPLIYAEYFFGHDPGFGLANEIIVSSNDTLLISELIPSEGLPIGVNRLSLRMKNENETWGISEQIEFYVRKDHTIIHEQIGGIEYFIDEDPGVGNGIFIDLLAADTILINEYLESQSLSDGIHQLGIRIQSDSGTWGLREWTEFEYLNCEENILDIDSELEFCIGDSVLIEGPMDYDAWFWSTYETEEYIYATESGEYFVSVYDSTNHQCFLSDTLNITMFLPPDASFIITSSYNTIEASAQGEGQDLFWQLNDEFSTTEASFSYTFISDGWQSICLEASNICGLEEICDTIITCSEFETAPFFYLDFDEDGFGGDSDSLQGCETPAGYADNMLDCDDDDDSIYPGAEEIPDDGIDQDCDGEDLVTGINDIDGIAFYYYPNPATNKVTIQFSSIFHGSIGIYDSAGKMMSSVSNKNKNEIILNVQNLMPGLYFLQISNENSSVVRKLIVQ